MREFPLPDKESSRAILERDYSYAKIPHDVVMSVYEEAWQFGEENAATFITQEITAEQWKVSDVLKRTGITIKVEPIDNVVKGQRYFCEFFPKQKELTLYKKSVLLWCEANSLSYEMGTEVILAHEYFHYLEWQNQNPASRLCTVSMFKIGKLKIGKTGIPALSEIAANAFSNTYYAHIKPNAVQEIGEEDV